MMIPNFRLELFAMLMAVLAMSVLIAITGIDGHYCMTVGIIVYVAIIWSVYGGGNTPK